MYEQSESLSPTAEKLGLTIQRADNVQRILSGPNAVAPLNNERFLEALFSSDSLSNQRNTDAVEFGSSQLVSGRIVAYTPAKQLGLDEVRDQVRAQYIAQAAKLAQKQGATELAAWQADATKAGVQLQAPVVVSRAETHNISPTVIAAALQVPVSQLPTLSVWIWVLRATRLPRSTLFCPTEDKPKELLSEMALIQYEQLHSCRRRGLLRNVEEEIQRSIQN